MEELYKAGRLKEVNTTIPRGKEQANMLLLLGWAELTIVTMKSDGSCTCLVPSQQDTNQKYEVDLTRGTCTCVAAAQRGMSRNHSR